MKLRDFLSHLESQGCSYSKSSKVYTANNPANGKSSQFASSAQLESSTCNSVCTDLGIASP